MALRRSARLPSSKAASVSTAAHPLNVNISPEAQPAQSRKRSNASNKANTSSKRSSKDSSSTQKNINVAAKGDAAFASSENKKTRASLGDNAQKSTSNKRGRVTEKGEKNEKASTAGRAQSTKKAKVDNNDTNHARPASPRKTNAPVQISTDRDKVVTMTSDKRDSHKPSTDNILQDAYEHLSRLDPKFESYIEKYPCTLFSPSAMQEKVDPFKNLTTGIMAQQVSGAATTAIKNRFVDLFTPPDFPTPAQVAKAELSLLRTAGLSGRKAEYIKGLAEKFDSGELGSEMLAVASDEEVMERLTAVRGLGRWSVEMFSFFGLKRMDVFSTGDLGVQ